MAVPRRHPSHACYTYINYGPLDHYKGSFGGRIFPLYGDASATSSNIAPAVLAQLSERWGRDVAADDVFAYVVGSPRLPPTRSGSPKT